MIPKAETNLARYGRAMLENLPRETTELLIDICTSNSLLTFDEATNEAVDDSGLPPAGRQQGFGPSYLSYLALNRGPATNETATTGTGTATVTARGRREGTVADDPVESTPPPTASALPGMGGTPATTQAPKSREPVKRPSPKVYFAHFVDHMEQFVIFLETVALRRWGQSVDESPSAATNVEKGDSDAPVDEDAERADEISVWNTLLELYLSISIRCEEGEKRMKAKALRILQSDEIPYDVNHALIVCSTCQFTPGLVLLWEKLGMHEDVLRFWMDKERASDSAGDEDGANNASEQLVHYLDLHGPKHRHLYPLVLRFLTSSEVLLNRHSKDVERVIDYVDEEKIMPSLAILQLLSRNGIASVGLVKGWLIRKIVEGRESIDMVRRSPAYPPPLLTAPLLGFTTYDFVQARDKGETCTGGGIFRPRPAQGVPRNSMLGMRRPTGPSKRSFHVQSQLSPAVSVYILARLARCSYPFV